MGNKAVRDLERRRRGLLVWHRLLPGHWTTNVCGGGYDVKRGADETWRALHQGRLLQEEIPRLGIAQDACQRHHEEHRASDASPASATLHEEE